MRLLGRWNGVGLAAVAAVTISLTGVSPVAHAATQTTIYVAPTGSDSASGTDSAHPFATVARARDAVRSIKAGGVMTGDIVVSIAPGNYYTSAPITFDQRDSGTGGYDVVYAASGAPGSVHLIGGTPITGWVPAGSSDVAGDLPSSSGIYKVQLNPQQARFDTLYVNDSRAINARTPNLVFDPRFPAARGPYLTSASGTNYGLTYRAGDLTAAQEKGLRDAQANVSAQTTTVNNLDAQVLVWDGPNWDWVTSTLPINSVDTTARTLAAAQSASDPAKNRVHWTIGTARYFVQGNISFLDSPGEYYYNKASGWLYYYPRPQDGPIGTQTIVAPLTQKVIELKGADKASLGAVPNPDQQVHDVTFRGLSIEDTDFPEYYSYAWNANDIYGGLGTFPTASAGSTSPSYAEFTERKEFMVGAITMTNTHDITVDKVRIRNTGLWGIVMYLDNNHNTVTNSAISNAGYGGILSDGGYPGVGKYNTDHTITNVLIHDIGQLVGHASGVTWMNTSSSQISHLEIFNSPRRSVQMMGTVNRVAADSGYNAATDMYNVNNHFSYLYVHDTEQDAGEDSTIFNFYMLEHDLGEGHYNYYDQVLIADTGANPSMHDKNSVGGFDSVHTAGLHVSNMKSVNSQGATLRITDRGTYPIYTDNTNDNYDSDQGIDTFDDSRMEYDKIGLTTATFPAEYAVTAPSTPATPSNVYFADDFEGPGVDPAKWSIEKGAPLLWPAHMSEDPKVGKRSLMIDGTANAGGVVLSRTFPTTVNKLVEVKYFDRRIDYAVNDSFDGQGNVLSPNSFFRADDGSTQHALGADGTVSKDFYLVKNGTTTSLTTVPRSYGWHDLKWDYTSGTDVKMYIDGVLVSTQSASGLKYLAAGDWTGVGGRAYYDQLYVYGGSGSGTAPLLPGGTGYIQAESRVAASGTTINPGGTGKIVGNINGGNWLKYSGVSFDAFLNNFTASVAADPASAGKKIDVRLDSTSGPVIGTLTVPSTGSWTTYKTVSIPLTSTTGVHDVYLVPQGSGSGFGNIDWFQFSNSALNRIEAESRTASSGTTVDAGGTGSIVGNINGGNWLKYSAVDFGTTGLNTLTASVAVYPASAGQKIEIRADGLSGRLLGTATIADTGGWSTYVTQKTQITPITGVHDVYLVPVGSGWGYANIDWFSFGKPATAEYQAENADARNGTKVISGGSGSVVGTFNQGNWLRFSSLDFGSIGLSTFSTSMAVPSTSAGWRFQIRLDSVTGPVVGTLTTTSTGGWTTFATQSTSITPTKGVHDVYLVASSGGSEGYADVDWVTFG